MSKSTPFAVKALFVFAAGIALFAAVAGNAKAMPGDTFGGDPLCREFRAPIRAVLDVTGYHFATVEGCLVIRSNGGDHIFGVYTYGNTEGLPDYTTVRYRIGYGADDNGN